MLLSFGKSKRAALVSTDDDAVPEALAGVVGDERLQRLLRDLVAIGGKLGFDVVGAMAGPLV
jgi:hypothetical protein